MAGKLSCDTASLISNFDEDSGEDLIDKPFGSLHVKDGGDKHSFQHGFQRSTTTAVLSSYQVNFDEPSSSNCRPRSNSLGREDVQRFMNCISKENHPTEPSTSVTIPCNIGPLHQMATSPEIPRSRVNTNDSSHMDQSTVEERDNLPDASSTLSAVADNPLDDGTDAMSNSTSASAHTVWEMNYHEAAIFLQVRLV